MFKRKQPERRGSRPGYDFRRAAELGRRLEKEMTEDLDMKFASGDRFLSTLERSELAKSRLDRLRQMGQEGLDTLAFMVEAVDHYDIRYIAVEMLGEFAGVGENLDFRPALRALRIALAADTQHLRTNEANRLHNAISDSYKKISGNYPSQCSNTWDKITD